MELPSKELILEVTGIEILSDYKIVVNNITYTSFKNDGVYITTLDNQLINIYELMHMMKVWAYDSGMPLTIIWANHIVHVRIGEKRFYANEKDEYDGVRQACEWILTQKENNEQA